MSKLKLKNVPLLLGIVFCMGLLQTEASTQTKSTSKIPVPAGGFTIVLRAPTSGNPQVIKIDKDGKEKSMQGLRVPLPEKTPIFFRVDQVNTVLYNVEITTEPSKGQSTEGGEGETNGEPLPSLSISDVRNILKDIYEPTVKDGLADTIKAADQKLAELKSKLHAAKALNSKLDELLYASETPNFCEFEGIKTQAAKFAVEEFELTDGTSKELWDKAEAVIDEVYEAWRDIEKDPSVGLPKRLSVLKELCDPDNKNTKKAETVVAVFAQTAKKLRMIETAKWYKDDTQERALTKSIEYTCVISPAVKSPETYPELRPLKWVVTVDTALELSGRKVTFGSFFTYFHDDTYVKVDDRIAIGVQDRFSEGFAVLTHIPFYTQNLDWLGFLKFRWAVALSSGLGIGSISNSDGSFGIGRVSTMLGVSCLFAPLKSESLLVFTVGRTIKPVQRLNGYTVGKTFPEKDGVTRPVRTAGWFFGMTISYDVPDALDKIRKIIKG